MNDSNMELLILRQEKQGLEQLTTQLAQKLELKEQQLAMQQKKMALKDQMSAKGETRLR